MNLQLGLLYLAPLSMALMCTATFVQGQDTSAPGAKPATAMPSVLTVPPEAQPSPHFSAEAGTNAYLGQIPADATSRSDAYFEGGYWLILWDFLAGVVISILLLQLRWSAAMRNFAERITRFKPLQTFVYWIEYLILKASSANANTGWPRKHSGRGWEIS
jgi:STE24 endopeptidase